MFPTRPLPPSVPPPDRPFVAIDFETADHGPDSACAVGLVRVEGLRVVGRATALIRPPRPRMSPRAWTTPAAATHPSASVGHRPSDSIDRRPDFAERRVDGEPGVVRGGGRRGDRSPPRRSIPAAVSRSDRRSGETGPAGVR